MSTFAPASSCTVTIRLVVHATRRIREEAYAYFSAQQPYYHGDRSLHQLEEPSPHRDASCAPPTQPDQAASIHHVVRTRDASQPIISVLVAYTYSNEAKSSAHKLMKVKYVPFKTSYNPWGFTRKVGANAHSKESQCIVKKRFRAWLSLMPAFSRGSIKIVVRV